MGKLSTPRKQSLTFACLRCNTPVLPRLVDFCRGPTAVLVRRNLKKNRGPQEKQRAGSNESKTRDLPSSVGVENPPIVQGREQWVASAELVRQGVGPTPRPARSASSPRADSRRRPEDLTKKDFARCRGLTDTPLRQISLSFPRFKAAALPGGISPGAIIELRQQRIVERPGKTSRRKQRPPNSKKHGHRWSRAQMQPGVRPRDPAEGAGGSGRSDLDRTALKTWARGPSRRGRKPPPDFGSGRAAG